MKKILIAIVLLLLAGCKEIPAKNEVCPKCMGYFQAVGPWTIDNGAPIKGVIRCAQSKIFKQCENCGYEKELK
jgi:hypothetical protein